MEIEGLEGFKHNKTIKSPEIRIPIMLKRGDVIKFWSFYY